MYIASAVDREICVNKSRQELSKLNVNFVHYTRIKPGLRV